MSGHLRILPATTPPEKHDHIDIIVGGQALRMTDPRRFGAVLWHALADGDLDHHVLLKIWVLNRWKISSVQNCCFARPGSAVLRSAGIAGRRYRGRRWQYLRIGKSV
jgi:hypothetical protein